LLGPCIDYRKILLAYMRHVKDENGATFAWHMYNERLRESGGLSDEELAELRRLDEEVRRKPP
jgi:hypothetical protein